MDNIVYWFLPKLNVKMLSFGILFALAFVGCNINDSSQGAKLSELKFIKEYNLDIPEPSGLTFNNTYDALYTVSDNTNKVCKISLNGMILSELSYHGNDLEGVTYQQNNNTLWIAEERLREVVNIDLNGNELARKKINISGSNNHGLEGICFDTTGTMYLLNEKEPNLWIKLKNDFSIIEKIKINSVGDLSGIAYDKKHKTFWIVSDESELLFKWLPQQGIIKSYNIRITKAEGVAVNEKLNRIYIVSDATSKLYVYQLNE